MGATAQQKGEVGRCLTVLITGELEGGPTGGCATLRKYGAAIAGALFLLAVWCDSRTVKLFQALSTDNGLSSPGASASQYKVARLAARTQAQAATAPAVAHPASPSCFRCAARVRCLAVRPWFHKALECSSPGCRWPRKREPGTQQQRARSRCGYATSGKRAGQLVPVASKACRPKLGACRGAKLLLQQLLGGLYRSAVAPQSSCASHHLARRRRPRRARPPARAHTLVNNHSRPFHLTFCFSTGVLECRGA